MLRRKLAKEGVDTETIHKLMQIIDFLMVLTYEEIPKGISYIRAHMNEGQYKLKFDAFWKYFLKKTTRYSHPLRITRRLRYLNLSKEANSRRIY